MYERAIARAPAAPQNTLAPRTHTRIVHCTTVQRHKDGAALITDYYNTGTEMSSGHGIAGGVGRCYPFFAEFKECLVSGMCYEFPDVLLCCVR